MNRFLTAAFVALAVVMSSATSVSAQVPPAGYPPRPPVVVLGGQFTRGGTGALDVGGATPNASYTGSIDGRIAVSDVADANGVLNFSGFAVPADFALNASHRITFADGSFLTFCVNGTGLVVACGSLVAPTQNQGNLVRTGTDSIELGLRVGVASIGAGALFLLWRRRRLATI
jgi:hypothetical protein